MKVKIQSKRKDLEIIDKKHLWHPFTQMKEWEDESPIIITEGKGSFLKDILGRWYLDGVSSIWVSVHGHRKEEIDRAIKEQIDRISHSTLLGLTHPPAVELAEQLVKITPKGLSRVFFSDNGSTAVEIGLKIAFQYWKNRGFIRKERFLALTHAYHGDTLGAVSVGGIDLFHKIFSPLLFKPYRAPAPYCYRCRYGRTHPSCRLFCLDKMELIVRKHHEKIAGLIIEPLVQGAGGMIVSPPGFLEGVRRLCKKHDILMIADEVATGFGRTGTMFACEEEGVKPDILCLAKGITGGYLPLAATVTNERIYRAFLGRYRDFKSFFHGHTYTGNQLACAAAIANLSLFKKEKIINNMQRKIALLRRGLADISLLPHVGDVRQKGFMVGIELVRERKSKTPYPAEEKMGARVCSRAREKGLIIRPLGNVIVLMPPLSVSRRELQSILQITKEAIREVTS
jgi:adenosylmethionine-8-amino-7-oxononanoate transaminase